MSSARALESVARLVRRMRRRRGGSRELLETYLDRIERHNPALNAIVALDTDAARVRADAADRALSRGESWGPLHGLPMTVKESYDVVGMPTTWGDPDLADNLPEKNAVVVDRLLGAGAIVFGKTNVPFMLGDWQTHNEVYGTTNNPWDVSRVPGGSSGGSAVALAAGLTALESGSDIGGSIRNPAHYCGVYGLKPTFGIVPTRGQARPGFLAPEDLAVVGPLARSADDLRLALSVIAGPDELDAAGWSLRLPRPPAKRLSEYRVAVMLEDPACNIDVELAERLQATVDGLARAGVEIHDGARLPVDTARSHDIYLQFLRGVTTAHRPRSAFEADRALAATFAPDDRSYAARVARAATQFHRDWVLADEERMHMRWRWAGFFEEYDLLLCPTAASAAFPHNHSGTRGDRTIRVNGKDMLEVNELFWVGLASVAYLPAAVAPIGLTASGLPVGIQIVGPHLGDLATIRFADLMADELGGFQAPPGWR